LRYSLAVNHFIHARSRIRDSGKVELNTTLNWGHGGLTFQEMMGIWGSCPKTFKSDHDCILILYFVNSSIGQSQLCVIRIARWKETHEHSPVYSHTCMDPFQFFLKLNKITTEIGVWLFTERCIILWILYKHVYYTKKSSTNRNKLGCIESWLLYIFL
jgi:hypothetical protein